MLCAAADETLDLPGLLLRVGLGPLLLKMDLTQRKSVAQRIEELAAKDLSIESDPVGPLVVRLWSAWMSVRSPGYGA